MSSAHVLLLVFLAVLQVIAQPENGDKSKQDAASVQRTEHSTGTTSYDKVSDETRLREVIDKFVKGWDFHQNTGATKTRPTRSKRWAESEKRPSYYYSSYMPTRYDNQRWRYPSNLMAILRGAKRSWVEEPRPSNDRWAYPSNLMALLRGKKSAMYEPEDTDDVEGEAVQNVMDRLADGWQYFVEHYVPEESSKRSSGWDNDQRTGNSRNFRPYGARQFLVLNGGRYIIG
ncbi:uncharacterized protein LOC124280948 [Haliotis rubra]|uniref:uncharacterized protein LOC124280948 n=1 Tax=Haliotis rubra TaxID=36100 RepID=UPI001EE54827|nr:uncharacterized protein LOC124280948 [Haliotis rubra]